MSATLNYPKNVLRTCARELRKIRRVAVSCQDNSLLWNEFEAITLDYVMVGITLFNVIDSAMCAVLRHCRLLLR